MSTLKVYNLEFPTNVMELDLEGYKFFRVPKYDEILPNLAHRITMTGGEYPITPNTGTHQQTATVEIPQNEKTPILPWDITGNYTRLQDILIFLSLFTGREVFALNDEEEKYPIRRDPREHFFGGQFHLSQRKTSVWRHRETGLLYKEEDIEEVPVFDYDMVDMSLEITINEVLTTIASSEWKKTYDDGYIVFLFRQAITQHGIEPAFLLCWTIWEHLFALHNKSWLDDVSIEQTSGEKKISFIINKYLLISISEGARKEIRRIAKARNRLAHFGKKPDNVEIKELTMFVRLTEQIMSIVLGLKPSNVFNSIEELQDLFKK